MSHDLKPLALTVLAHDGPQARAYALALRAAGWQPRRVVQVIEQRHLATRQPVGRWLPGPLRRSYARLVHDRAANHWPRRLRQTHPQLFACMVETMAERIPAAREIIDGMLAPFDWRAHGSEYEALLVDGLTDAQIGPALARHGPTDVLYTGGGLLREALLTTPGLRFLHVHPGYLPAVRGADGLLWSTLVRGRPGLTCFFQDTGIDTGAVIARREHEPLEFPLGPASRPDPATLYRALFSYCDPLLRADFFARTVVTGSDLGPLLADPQGTATGLTYHFMHSDLRTKALGSLFPAAA